VDVNIAVIRDVAVVRNALLVLSTGAAWLLPTTAPSSLSCTSSKQLTQQPLSKVS